MADKYLLFDLDDDKSKKLGEVISNPTCKKIVNFLAEKESSALDIAKELEMPLNTIGYNLGKLIDAGLIEKSKSFWSVKGKRIETYKVANKLIVISPKKSSGVYNKLKGIVPVVLISGILTAALAWFYNSKEAVNFVAEKAADNSGALAATTPAAQETFNRAASLLSVSSPWLWFGIGALVALIAFMIWNWKKL